MVKDEGWSLIKTGLVAGLVGVTALTTIIIRIPIPATTGYFNLGDIFVIFTGIWLGPVPGLIVGAIGPAFADLIGFPVFVPATLVTKGLEGLAVGLIAGAPNSTSFARRVIAAFVGGAIMVIGYFLFEALLYPAIGKFVPIFAVTDIGAAIIEIAPNTVQGVLSAIGSLALWKAVSGYRRQSSTSAVS
jgi:uncharacterized membrane protein